MCLIICVIILLLDLKDNVDLDIYLWFILFIYIDVNVLFNDV